MGVSRYAAALTGAGFCQFHIWTLAGLQGVFIVLVLRSGAVMYPALGCGSTWPLALMKSADRLPIKASRFVALGIGRVLSIPGANRFAIRSRSPSQNLEAEAQADTPTASC